MKMNETILKNGKLIVKITKEFDTTKDVNLRGISITSLPDNLSVGGSLNLRGTSITKKNIPTHLIKKCKGLK